MLAFRKPNHKSAFCEIQKSALIIIDLFVKSEKNLVVYDQIHRLRSASELGNRSSYAAKEASIDYTPRQKIVESYFDHLISGIDPTGSTHP